MYKKLLVGVDWSEASLKAVEKAVEMAKAMGSKLVLVTVVPPPTVFLGEAMAPEVVDTTPLVEATRRKLSELADRYREEHKVEVLVEVIVGEPSESIVEYATEIEADLIVLGKRRLSGIERFILGSVTKKVVEKSPVDVLIVT
ncbi:MAG: universal stress protein [Desulfurococcales archaeon]|nr:universal stress protein [Desulfurococcales archaeon]